METKCTLVKTILQNYILYKNDLCADSSMLTKTYISSNQQSTIYMDDLCHSDQ